MNLLLPILVPGLAALVTLAIPRSGRLVRDTFVLLAALLNLVIAMRLFGREATFAADWGGYGMDFTLRLYAFSGFILLAAAGFGLLTGLYGVPFLKEHRHAGQYHAYFLLTLAFSNGAALADNLVAFLFFWEGLLGMLFGMIVIGRPGAIKTAVKAFVIVGVTDLCLMLGICLASWQAGTWSMSQMHLPLNAVGTIAFLLMAIGAGAKAGAMPFHSWIPDAAEDAPLPFMAFVPAAMEKLLGIYFLARISLDLFQFQPDTLASYVLMIVGAVTILLAVMMALVQKDYKRLLAFHAISQVGYMILGIGTAVPAGIVGGLFHMINHALYKCCLFLTGGAVERQAGTTDLAKLGGLARRMPLTFGCFIVAAASISGVPPFNGFFSKELVYEGALERGLVFYIAAALGSLLTAASFLKLGHAAYLGKEGEASKVAKEAPVTMWLPMIVIAGLCVLFGLWRALPLGTLIQPSLAEHWLEGHDFAHAPISWGLTGATLLVLLAAVLNHAWGVKRTGCGLKAVDHIHYAPGLKQVYEQAEARVFDPYEIGMELARIVAWAAMSVDRAVDWLVAGAVAAAARCASQGARLLSAVNHSFYILWSLIGLAAVIAAMAGRLW